MSDWLEVFGSSGTFTLIVQQNGVGFYIQTITQPGSGSGRIPGVVQWNVTGSNTTVVGLGKCELQYVIGQVIVKSIIYDIAVTNSLDA